MTDIEKCPSCGRDVTVVFENESLGLMRYEPIESENERVGRRFLEWLERKDFDWRFGDVGIRLIQQLAEEWRR